MIEQSDFGSFGLSVIRDYSGKLLVFETQSTNRGKLRIGCWTLRDLVEAAKIVDAREDVEKAEEVTRELSAKYTLLEERLTRLEQKKGWWARCVKTFSLR